VETYLILDESHDPAFLKEQNWKQHLTAVLKKIWIACLSCYSTSSGNTGSLLCYRRLLVVLFIVKEPHNSALYFWLIYERVLMISVSIFPPALSCPSELHSIHFNPECTTVELCRLTTFSDHICLRNPQSETGGTSKGEEQVGEKEWSGEKITKIEMHLTFFHLFRYFRS